MEWFVHDEASSDVVARECLLNRTMGPGRKSVGSESLREGNVPAVALVAKDAAGTLIGTVRLWPVSVHGAGAVLMLGPLAVDPGCGGRGLGSRLLVQSVETARALGWEAIVLVGDPGYYGRFGFDPYGDIVMPGRSSAGRCLLGLELRKGALGDAAGKVTRIADDHVRLAA